MSPNKIESENINYLKIFQNSLSSKGLSKKTITSHVNNIDLFVNVFLCDYLEEDVVQGCYYVSRFLGDWFIRKALWSSCSHIKDNAASLKKFYACMLENGIVAKDDYDTLCETIKDEMPYWLEEMQRFESIDYDDDFFDL